MIRAFCCLVVVLCIASVEGVAGSQPLASFEHHVVGAQLEVTPGAEIYVPKDIPGSFVATIRTLDGTIRPELSNALAAGAHVEAVLRGPGMPSHRLLGLPGEPIYLPPLAVLGDYTIDNVRLVETESGRTLLAGSPSRVLVHVFPEVLVSSVTSRPLTLEEIQDRNIVIDDDSFTTLEFTATFIVEGEAYSVGFPVVAPKFKGPVELYSLAEFRDRSVQADAINRSLAHDFEFPPEMARPNLNIQLQAVNYQALEPKDLIDAPPGNIPLSGLLVIPGSVAFLNQFFSVQLYTANASPMGSGLSVHDISATIRLPTGPDLVEGSDDDPLRMARIGPSAQTITTVPVRAAGADGTPGTADDQGRLQPGETGYAEFLVEGLRDGLHTLDIDLTGTLDGLSHGEVEVMGSAAGSVLVRNPTFSMVFSHPRTVSVEEPYTASVTILNTSESPASLVSVNLNTAAISGARLATGQPTQVQFDTIAPGESRTAEFRLIAERNGHVALSNLQVSNGLTGRFDLKMGVDERGVALTGNTIVYPEWFDLLPSGVQLAATRVLSQALATSVAGFLPPGVRRVGDATVQTRAVELAEAGQRLYYGDDRPQVFVDLLLDWHGGRSSDLAFDQILRTTGAGAQFAAAITSAIEAEGVAIDPPGLAGRSARLADRREAWGVAAAVAGVEVSVNDGGRISLAVPVSGEGALQAAALESGVYGGIGGWWLPARAPQARGEAFEVMFRVPVSSLGGEASWTQVAADGTGTRFTFIASPTAEADVCYRVLANVAPLRVRVDEQCDGAISDEVAHTATPIVETSPSVVSVQHDENIQVGRPYPSCGGPTFVRTGSQPRPWRNYATVIAVLFSKPVDPASIEASDFFLDDGTRARSVAVQPGGRIALLSLDKPHGGLIPHAMTVGGVSDFRSQSVGATSMGIGRASSEGVRVRGAVYGADGAPAGGIPVTLTMADEHASSLGCSSVYVATSQILTAADGTFSFDFVPGGYRGYQLSAVDTRGLDPRVVDIYRRAAAQGRFDPDELEQLAQSPEDLQALLDAFEGATLDGIASAVEAVDRAELFDPLPAHRLGGEVPVALRFRGRGQVRVRVLAADGRTVVPEAAVNLSPDRSSREKPRGQFSDPDGRVAFYGVPLGPFSVSAETSDGRGRVVSGILQRPGEVAEIDVILSQGAYPEGDLVVQVRDPDGTPHPLARVFVQFGDDSATALGVRVGTADLNGELTLQGPAVRSIVAVVSSDGATFAEQKVTLQAGATTYFPIQLPGRATLDGRVLLADGRPVAHARVIAGYQQTTTDAQGQFSFAEVATGDLTVAAGITVEDAEPTLNLRFPKVGQTAVDVVPGGQNYAVITMGQAGLITGRVFDAAGAALPGVRVAVPSADGGFYWADADGTGAYSVGPLPLGSYFVSAPAPPVTDGAGDLIAPASQSMEALRATYIAAVQQYIGGLIPVPFNSGRFGYARASLDFDNQVENVDIRYLPTGEVSGTVQNAQGVPIGANVDVQAIALGETGSPKKRVVASGRSDLASGAFLFSGVAVGDVTVQGNSPFFQNRPTVTTLTTPATPNATGLLLQFLDDPPPGRITGVVLADGVPVGAGATVGVPGYLTGDYQVTTDAHGRFQTIDLPSRSYFLEALDPATARVGFTSVHVASGVIADVAINLFTVNSTLTVAVLMADGQTVAEGADVTVRRMGRPADVAQAITDGQGLASFVQLTEGTYAIEACLTVSQTRRCQSKTRALGSSSAEVVTVYLDPSGAVAGRYVEADGVTPVDFAQISIGNVAFAVTSTDGTFHADGIPLGVHAILGRNAVTGRAARSEARVMYDGETVQVLLREDPLGDVIGRVYDVDHTSLVPAAAVTLSPSSPLFSPQSVTSGPQGDFSFVGVPPGDLFVSARDPLTGSAGQAASVMPDAPTTVDVPVFFEPRGDVLVRVFDAAGHPAMSSARARLVGQTGMVGTSSVGDVRFTRLRLGTYTVHAESAVSGQTRSVGTTTVALAQAGLESSVDIQLAGVGQIAGTVLQNAAPQSDVEVRARFAVLGASVEETVLTNPSGGFAFDNLPVGPVEVVATRGPVSARTIATVVAGQITDAPLTLVTTATVSGRLVRADGVTPVVGADIALRYATLFGLAQGVTDSLGGFTFAGVPEGGFTLLASVTEFDGVLEHFATVPGPLDPAAVNEVDVGTLRLDEARPEIVSVFPADGTTEVPGTTTIEIQFSEPMDPLYDDVDGAYVTDGVGRIPATLSWTGPPGLPPDTLIITPTSDLAGETTYSVVVLAGEQFNAAGTVAARGPYDLAQRYLSSVFVSQFRTRDTTPPLLLSLSPADLAAQIPRESVIRASFSEPVDPQTSTLVLLASGGTPVSGTQTFGLNRQIIVFTPSQYLELNATYEAVLSGVQDDAGNPLAAQPIRSTFATTDTLGPVVIDLETVPPGQSLVAGQTALFSATLADGAEAEVQLELTPDLSTFSRSAIGALTASVAVGSDDTLRLRGRAYDRFGNVGPWYEKTFPVGSNGPPQVSIAQLVPVGSLKTGDAFEIRATATDETGVAQLSMTGTGLPTPLSAQVFNENIATLIGTVPPDLGPNKTLIINASATDPFGLVGTAAQTIPIADGTPPTVDVTWPASSVDPGTTVTIPVTASDNFGVSSLSLAYSGAASGNDGGPLVPERAEYARTFEITIPSGASPGATIQVTITAADGAGEMTSVNQTFTISTAGPPAVVAATPAAGATGVSVQTSISVTFSEPVQGVLSGLSLSPAPPGGAPTVTYNAATRTAQLTPVGDLAPDTTYTVALVGITDDAGDPLTPPNPPLTFSTEASNLDGPQLVAIRPVDVATNVALSLVLEYEFDEPIAGAPTGLLDLAEDVLDAPAIAVTEAWLDGGRRYQATASPTDLRPGTTYRATFAGQTLEDVDGNPARGLQGGTMTSALETTFTTAQIQLTVVSWTPAGTPRVVAGHQARLGVTAESAVLLERTEWQVAGASAGVPDSYERQPVQIVSIPDQAAGSTVELGATVTVVGGATYDLPVVSATVEAEAGDYDGDGLQNGAEVLFGLNPWLAADATQDPDGDGRTNAQEVADGTDPFVADSLGNRAPAAGIVAASSALGLASGGYLDLPAATQLADGLTWEIWAYLDGTGPIFVSGEPSGAGTAGLAVTFDGLDLTFTLTTSGSGSQSWSVPVVAPAWRHIAFSYDGARFRAYVDGLIRVDAAASGSVIYASSVTRIGTTSAGVSPTSTYVGEVRLWTTARPLRELQLDMQRGLGGYETDLFGYWPLDEGAGLVATSIGSGVGLDGTVTDTWASSPARSFVVSPSLNVPQGYTPLELTGLDADGHALTYVIDQLPQNGTLYESADGITPGAALTTVPVTLTLPPTGGPKVLFEPRAGFLGTNTFRFHVNDGTVSSRDAVVTLTSSVDKTWVGGVSDLWAEGGNWMPAGVPSATDTVVIPAGTTSTVTLTADAAAGAVSIGLGSAIDVATYTLTVASGVDNEGHIIGTGTLILAGVQPSLRGEVPNVETPNGPLNISGRTHVTGALTTSAGLRVGGYSVRVDGLVDVVGPVDMGGSNAEIDAGGHLYLGYNGCLPSADLSQGVLRAAADVRLNVCNADSYTAPGAHLIMDGTGSQGLWVYNAYFRRLEIFNGIGAVALNTSVQAADVVIGRDANVTSGSNGNLTVSGTLTVGDDATVSIGGTLTVDGSISVGVGAQVSATTLDVPSSGGLPPVSAINYRIDASTTIASDFTISGTLDVLGVGTVVTVPPGVTLTVGGQATIDPGTVIDIDGTMTVGGTMILDGSALMTESSSWLAVGSTLHIGYNNGCTTEGSQWTAGTLWVSGALDIWGTGCGDPRVFASLESHQVVMDGAYSASGVSLNMRNRAPLSGATPSAPNHFNQLEIANAGHGDVVIGTAFSVFGEVVVAPNAVLRRNRATQWQDRPLILVGNMSVGSGASVSLDALQMEGAITPALGVDVGDLTVFPATTFPWGATIHDLTLQKSLHVASDLSVGGDLVQEAGTVTVDPSVQLQVLGQATIDPGTVIDIDGTMTVGGTMILDGSALMTGSSSWLAVGSTLHVGYNNGCTTEGSQWTAGTLWVSGTLDIWGTGCGDPRVFASLESHRVVMDGAYSASGVSLNMRNRAPLSGATPSAPNHFNRLEIANAGHGDVVIGTAFSVFGEVVVAPNAVLRRNRATQWQDRPLILVGNMSVGSGASVSLDALQMEGAITPALGVDVGDLTVLPATTFPWGAIIHDLTLQKSLHVASDLSVGGDLVQETGTSTVDSSVQLQVLGRATIDPGAVIDIDGTMTVGGSMILDGSVLMTESSSWLAVGSTLHIGYNNGCTTEGSQWTAGTLWVSGTLDIWGTGCGDPRVFVSLESHRVVMDGAYSASGVSLNMRNRAPLSGATPSAPNHFNRLEIANAGHGDVVIGTAFSVFGEVVVAPNAVLRRNRATEWRDRPLILVGNTSVGSGASVSLDALQMEGAITPALGVDVGDLTVLPATTFPWGAIIHDLTLQESLHVASDLSVGGDLVQETGTSTVDSSVQLQVLGRATIDPGAVIDIDGMMTVGGVMVLNGSALMTESSSWLAVGSALHVGYSTGCTTEGSQWTAGTLRLSGDLDIWGISCGEDWVFESSGSHSVVFDGASGTQTVSMASPAPPSGPSGSNRNRFNAVTVANTGSIVSWPTSLITGDLTVQGHLMVPTSRAVTIDGQLTTGSAATLDIQGTSTIDVSGSCSLDASTSLPGSSPACP